MKTSNLCFRDTKFFHNVWVDPLRWGRHIAHVLFLCVMEQRRAHQLVVVRIETAGEDGDTPRVVCYCLNSQHLLCVEATNFPCFDQVFNVHCAFLRSIHCIAAMRQSGATIIEAYFRAFSKSLSLASVQAQCIGTRVLVKIMFE